MLTSLRITPPLAFARIGSSDTPCAAFSWSPADLSPSGSARTTLAVEETLTLDADGTVRSALPNAVRFKEADGRLCPVAPFFELHGTWEFDGAAHAGPITPAVLAALGLTLADVRWSVTLGNLKAFHFTLDDGDRIVATLSLRGDEHLRRPLEGRSPTGPGITPLILAGRALPMGAAQVAKPSADFPELRLRVTPPVGAVYGPTNLAERIAAVAGLPANAEWAGFDLPATQKIVDPAARWARLNLETEGPPPLGAGDPRNNPGGLSATLMEPRGLPPAVRNVPISMGLVDDVSDGIVRCAVGGQTAAARVVIGPPDFAPMNRPVVSLQDGLSDRMLRDAPRVGALSDAELEAIVADIFERALETAELMNKDAQNDRARGENRPGVAGNDLPLPASDFEENPRGTLWPTINPATTAAPVPLGALEADAMPVSFRGQRKHKRYNALEYVRDRLREEPDLIEKWLRPPRDPSPLYDRRMPALMRGSDRHPMHLTRRQYEIIRLWAAKQAGV
jgi:hypothetical protein